MLYLDFSQPNYDVNAIEVTNEFEQSIKDFLVEWFSDSEVMIAHTSGSTGTPKEIILTKENMRKSANMTGKHLHLEKGNSALLVMPVTYIAGKLMLVRAVEIGLKLICMQPTSHISLNEINSGISQNFTSIDFVALTPMQVENSLDFVSRCQKLIIGGAPLSEKVKQELFAFENEVYETYAMTETITHIAFKQVANQKYPNAEQVFEAFDEVTISQDERGCLVIDTPYDGLQVVTNDVVELIDTRKFNWIGRADNVINSGGIKLFPEQIENKLKPFIDSDFYITSKTDELLGQKLILVVEGEQRSLDFSLADLTKYQQPKEIVFIDQFPRTESGKVKRQQF
ncbi:AMP-binding protein [Empedobacter falsenii]|uniref:Long-chain fatty acid--CoA ligase n=1 Tax=Empedobacter falsenii TaxID=343874 RepID=A0A427BKU0_9FLAO|nr:AMP-binding protein [Empedobacter falsenii]RRT90093.1 long-chain fatty acid--CoA ligase [Empedobacter falsenii]RRT90130.1 long-chain fatty acid--CoA ligase [Empedobacter falsenii]